MSTSIDSELQQTLRDALVAYFLNEVVPNATKFVSAGLSDKIKVPNDLYQYLLIDNQISHVVQSSPVASAIASVQQYINAALMSMEPGYEHRVMEEHLITYWRTIQCQYPLWAADQQLHNYPEIYINPRLRMNKSTYFRQLETDINQNQINVDTAQEAVKSYLTGFEEVANLKILNGYITTDDFKNGMYYFVGQSPGERQYYWRSVDMSQRSPKQINQPAGPKVDYPQSGAWSDWYKAALPISAGAIERTIRPVYFNNRLFVFWVELIDRSAEALTLELRDIPVPTPPEKPPVVKAAANPMLHLNMVYKKYDDSWSAPHTVIEAWSESPLFKGPGVVDLIDSIVVQDSSSSPDSLFVAMYAGHIPGGANDGIADEYAFLKTAFIDRNFNVTPLFPSVGYVNKESTRPEPKKVHVLKLGRIFARDNKNRFQFKMPTLSIGIKSVENYAPHAGSDSWNFSKWQGRIKNSTVDSGVKYNQHSQRLEFDSQIVETFSSVVNYTVLVSDTSYSRFQLHLVTPDVHSGAGEHTLLGGSIIRADYGMSFAQGWYKVVVYLSDGTEGNLLSDDSSERFFIPAIPVGGSAPIRGMKASKKVIGELAAGRMGLYVKLVHASHNIWRYSSSVSHRLSNGQGFESVIGKPSDMTRFDPPVNGIDYISWSALASALYPPSTLKYLLPINSDTLLPDWNTNWQGQSKKIPLIHGVKIRNGNYIVYAQKIAVIELELKPAVTGLLIAPRLSTRTSPTLGVAEFIDFRGSGIQYTDGSSTVLRQPIRMNTLFARELINKANIALESLLDWSTQHLQEPPLDPSSGNNLMDFRGANGKYFWELFLHLPFLVSHRMYLEQQFDDAERWLAFIFDPARKANADGRPAYWNVRPLMDDPDLDAVSRAPADPDGIAESHPVRYRKAVYLHYLTILLSRGDNAYRQLTPDSLGEAKLWYVRILDLLGPRPDVKLVDSWVPITLQTLANSSNPGLREYEQRLIAQDQLREDLASTDQGDVGYAFREPALCLRTFTPDPTLRDLDTDYLRLAFNAKLVETWDKVEWRLNNLRSNRTLDGRALSLSLFAAPLNPQDLQAAFGQGASAGGAGRLLAQSVPPYRFNVMHAAARGAVETLIQFGQGLLSLIERKEQAQVQELQQQQMWTFARFAIDLQEQAKRIDEQQYKALEASKTVIQGRLDFYIERVKEGVNLGEIAAAKLYLAGGIADAVGTVASTVAAGLQVLPNAVGGGGGGGAGVCFGFPPLPSAGGGGSFALGGWRVEGVPRMAMAAAFGLARLSHTSANMLDRAEQLRERHQQWTLARDQADLELEQIDAQLSVLKEQMKATDIQLREAELAQKQAKETYDFLGKRFTNAQLYQWLNGQFASFYYQAYDATLAMCLAAEACWQFEIADFTTRFIQTGGWNDSQRGLGAGEALKLQLLRMEAAYLNRHERLLDITKTVSLRQLKAMDDDPASINQSWDDMHEALLLGGVVRFELSKTLFENDYLGCELRRIQRVGVSLPLVLGPYEDVSVTLTQTYSAVQIGGMLKENLQAGQQVVLSHGENDDGRFTPAGDGRYDAFEGTGAISRWALEFTEQDLELRKRQINALSDIILHLSYTARAGQE